MVLAGEELLSIQVGDKQMMVHTGKLLIRRFFHNLVFANDIPKGASRGAATPTGELLRMDMASVCIAGGCDCSRRDLKLQWLYIKVLSRI